MNHSTSNVQTRTRLSQFGIISLLFLPLLIVAVITLPETVPIPLKVGVCFTAILLVCWLIWAHSSKPEVVNVEPDKITFKYRAPIPFDQIETFNFDDYLKIKIRGEFWTVLLQCTRKNQQEYTLFLREFRAAFSAWQQRNITTTLPMPQQSFFYGSWEAKLTGGGLLIAYIVLVLVALRLNIAMVQVTSAGALIVPISLHLLLSKRRP